MKRTLASMICLVLLAGCGQVASDMSSRPSRAKSSESFESVVSRQPKPVSLELDTDGQLGGEELAAGIQAPPERKIIYKANISIVVKSFDHVEKSINDLVAMHHGYVANFNENRSQGDNRSATWVVRVPSGGFNDVLDSVADLGIPESRQVDSDDVSEQFVDLEAQLKNRRRLEEEILQLLENRDGDLEDILTIKHELATVREEIERIEGRLRFLTDRVELTTITINVRQEKDYVPAQAPTFASRINDTWQDSLSTLTSAGQEIVLILVGAAPWLAILLILIAPPIWLIRRSMLRTSQRA